MKTNKETLRTAMDRRLSFLDDVPSCRAAVQYRIAQEEEPVMKKKVSFGFVFAMVIVLLSVAALAAGLLISPRVSATRTADRALEETYGVTEEMQTFFGREEQELPDGALQVTYTGAGNLSLVLGTYTAVVRDGKAEVSWSFDGEDTAGGYDAPAWGTEQLRQMLADSLNEGSKKAFMARADERAEANGAVDDEEEEEEEDPSEAAENYGKKREAEKTAAMKARKLSEEEMIETGREFIITSFQLNEDQAARLDLYTNTFRDSENTWYEMVNGKPCFLVEYLLGQDPKQERSEKDGYYQIYVNVENGTVEQYVYDAALGGLG